MLCRFATIGAVWFGLLCCGSPSIAQQQPKQQKKAPGKTQQASLTGCIDEQDGKYVLIHDQTRALIANLEADGFPAEGFARHVGHKVTVRGTANPDGAASPVFKVRTVETLSETCGPQDL